MKIPRDISGAELARILKRFGYEVARQTGSHMRLTRRHADGEQHITIPRHDSLKIGTLNGIPGEIALQIGVGKEELIETLFS